MRRSLFAALSAGLVFLVAACGSSPATSTAPGGATQVPGATQAPGGASQAPVVTPAPIQSIVIPTPPPGGGTASGTECAAFPTFSLANPLPPSFPPDTTLEAKFPATIDGQPVKDLSTS